MTPAFPRCTGPNIGDAGYNSLYHSTSTGLTCSGLPWFAALTKVRQILKDKKHSAICAVLEYFASAIKFVDFLVTLSTLPSNLGHFHAQSSNLSSYIDRYHLRECLVY